MFPDSIPAGVPIAVNDFGFVPFCTPGNEDGHISYTRKSLGHDASIRGVANGTYEAAAIESDLLKRATSRGDISQDDVRVLYESEQFVSVAIGHLCSLTRALAESVRATRSAFQRSFRCSALFLVLPGLRFQQVYECGFIQDFHAELFRLFEFGTRFFARHQVVGLLADAGAHLAAGRFDAFWEFGLAEWDMAAGALLIQEAGGLVSDFSGGHQFLDKGHIVAGNPKCFKAVLTAIQPHLTPSMKM